MAKFEINLFEKEFVKNKTFKIEEAGFIKKYFFDFDISKLSKDEILKSIKEKKYNKNSIVIK